MNNVGKRGRGRLKNHFARNGVPKSATCDILGCCKGYCKFSVVGGIVKGVVNFGVL